MSSIAFPVSKTRLSAHSSIFHTHVYRYKKMWYECQWDNSPSKSQFVKVNYYRSMYGLQHGAFAHTKQQAIKEGRKIPEGQSNS